MSDMTPEPWRSHRRGGEGSWMIGVVLILLGTAFMMERTGVISMVGNWWAVFIYLAAMASFVSAWRSYRSGAPFGSQASGSLIWGLVLTVVASILLFGLEWDMWWPAIVIAVGVGMVASQLIGNAIRKREES